MALIVPLATIVNNTYWHYPFHNIRVSMPLAILAHPIVHRARNQANVRRAYMKRMRELAKTHPIVMSLYKMKFIAMSKKALQARNRYAKKVAQNREIRRRVMRSITSYLD